jgi:hypothetical protein
MRINGETILVYKIKPIDGANNNEPFEFEVSLSKIERMGLGLALIENTNHWRSMGHDSDHFEILIRYTK